MRFRWASLLKLATALALAPPMANAATLTCITGTSNNCGLATTTMAWTWNGLDLTLANNSGSYVSEVYFDLGSGMAVSFLNGTGGNVLFYSGANPASLPGGSSLGFVSDQGFDSDSPGNQHNGLDNGETVTFRITGADLGSFDSGALNVGVHARGLTDAGASLVTVAPAAVPEPDTLALLGIGLGLGLAGLAATRRRKLD